MASAGSTLIPSLRYRDAPAAIEWLCDVLGFYKHAVHEGPNRTIAHAELTLGSGMIMLGSASNPSPYPQHTVHPDEVGGRSMAPVYIIVPDCNPVYARVQASGAELLMELRTMEYGGQAFSIRDAEGYHWAVGEYDPWAAHEAGTEPA